MKLLVDNNKLGRIIALTLSVSVTLAIATTARGISVDGRFDPGEGYTSGWYVDLRVDGTKDLAEMTVPGGELWVHQDSSTGDVFVLLSQPLTLIDNTYGVNSIGWGAAARSGKDHKFTDLLGSDKIGDGKNLAGVEFTDGLGTVVLDVTVDYIAETSKDSGVYLSGGVGGGPTHKNEGAVNVGLAANVLAWGTSLDYNFNTLHHVLTVNSPATDSDYTENPTYPGWEFQVIYELQVSGDLFEANGFGGVSIDVVHDSPNKIGGNKVYPEIAGPIPEPLTIVGVMAGIGALAGYVRRRGLYRHTS